MTTQQLALFDIGVNLASNQFTSDLDEVLRRAREHQVLAQLITGSSVASTESAIALAEQHSDLFATAGIHPHDASQFNASSLNQIKSLASHPKVLAVGETGLDFNRDFSPRDKQEAAFESQLALASELKKPTFLHQRDAHQRFLPILKSHRDNLTNAVVHCFTGSKEELFAYLDLDCHIGITGWICDKRRGKELRQIANNIPNNRLLIETDAPYLLPHNLEDAMGLSATIRRRNEPAFLFAVLEQLAQCRQQTSEQLASLCFTNSLNFLALDRSQFEANISVKD